MSSVKIAQFEAPIYTTITDNTAQEQLDLEAQVFNLLRLQYPGVEFSGRVDRNTYIDPRTQIAPGAKMVLANRLTIIGNSKIGENAQIYGNCTIIDSDVDGIILAGSTLKTTTVGRDALIAGATLIDSKVECRMARDGTTWEKAAITGGIFDNALVVGKTFDQIRVKTRAGMFSMAYDSVARELRYTAPDGIPVKPVKSIFGRKFPFASNGVSYDAEPPVHFLDPITMDLISDAVITPSGISYDRASLQKWLDPTAGSGTDPSTREPLSLTQLIPNRIMQSMIEEWKQEHRKQF